MACRLNSARLQQSKSARSSLNDNGIRTCHASGTKPACLLYAENDWDWEAKALRLTTHLVRRSSCKREFR
jgi:hypothetical protein